MTAGPPEVGGVRLERRRVVVFGRVQGVWFRDSCRNEAISHQVSGYVRNCADGTVEAVFEGAGVNVGALVAWCRVGPPLASVESVEVTAETAVGMSGFQIR